MSDCTTFGSKPALTISGTSIITKFLTTSSNSTFGNALAPNIIMTIDGVLISNTDPIAATTSFVSTFLSDNGLKIVDGNHPHGDRTVQIIYPGDIIIDQSIALFGANLVIMSVYGNITINPGITLLTEGFVAGVPTSISLFAINSIINNKGTIGADLYGGYINLFSNNTINIGSLLTVGTIIVSNNFTNSGTHTDNLLYDPGCHTPPLIIESITNTTCATVPGSTFSFNTNWCVNYSSNTIKNFFAFDNSLFIIHNGPIEIPSDVTMPSDWSLQILTPCDLICTSDGTLTGTPVDIESGLDTNGLSTNFIVGGALIVGSLATQDLGSIFLTVGDYIVAVAKSTYPEGANAGIGGANHVSPDSIVVACGGNISVIGGTSNNFGNGAGIGGGGGYVLSGSNTSYPAGQSNIITVTAGGLIDSKAPLSPYEGGAAGVGGGGAAGSDHAGGSANAPITLTSGNQINILGGSMGDNYSGAGAGIGGGGGGSTFKTGARGGQLSGVTTLTALSSITIQGGSANAAGAGIGGGGGTKDGGIVDPANLPVYAAAPFFPYIIPGQGNNASYKGQEAQTKLFVFTSFSCPVIIADQTFVVYNNVPLGTALFPNITVSPSSSTITITQQVDPYGNLVTSDFSFSIIGNTIYTNNSSLTLGNYLLSVEASYSRYTSSTAFLTIDVQTPPTTTSLTAVWIVFAILSGATLAIAIAALIKALPRKHVQNA